MEIRTADSAACHLNDRVASILYLWVGNRIATYVLLAVPDECPHRRSPSRVRTAASLDWLANIKHFRSFQPQFRFFGDPSDPAMAKHKPVSFDDRQYRCRLLLDHAFSWTQVRS